MELLKVGDKVYNKEYSRWSSFISYEFATVDRLTSKRAVLSNGKVLLNEPRESGWGGKKEIGYKVHGESYAYYHIETPEIIEEAKKEKLRVTIHDWFSQKKFTEAEKTIIYNHFKELDILTNKTT